MTETQSSICAWADATFGPPVSDVSIAARALHEMAELVTACVYGEPAEEIAVEIADVVIVLARLGRALDVDVVKLFDLDYLRPSRHDAEWHAFNASKHVADCGKARDDTWRFAALRWSIGALAALARDLGINLPAAIDAKMAVNRARKWKVDGRGHGEHVEEEESR